MFEIKFSDPSTKAGQVLMHMRLLGWSLITAKMDMSQIREGKNIVYNVNMATWWVFNGEKKTWQEFVDACLVEFPQPRPRVLAEDMEFSDKHTE